MTATLTGNPTLMDSGINSPPKNPLLLLENWLKIAEKLGIIEPRGMVLSTVDNLVRPSSRVVLLKECDETGVIFGTSEGSAKGKDLLASPYAAGNLWWRETIQQVRFSGKVTQLPDEKSDEIFQERTREAQAATVVSKQSMPLSDIEELKKNMLRLVNAPGQIERPAGWHAYHLAIASIEFWQGSQDRLHKRLRYDLVNGSWNYQYLQP